MKLTALLLFTVIALAGCSTTSNNANMRGANTNTGYVTNSETNAKPTMPSNVTNVSPPSITGNGNTARNVNSTGNTNVNKKP